VCLPSSEPPPAAVAVSERPFADPDKPDKELNQVDPRFPPNYTPGQLSGVTLRSTAIFQQWAQETADARGRIVAKKHGHAYTLHWKELP
jgi:hypothetical protein